MNEILDELNEILEALGPVSGEVTLTLPGGRQIKGKRFVILHNPNEDLEELRELLRRSDPFGTTFRLQPTDVCRPGELFIGKEEQPKAPFELTQVKL